MYHQTQPAAGIGTYVNLGSDILLKSFLLLLIQAIACYTFIYFLLPRHLIKAQWLKLTTGILLLCIIVVIAGYYVHGWLFPLVDSIFNNPPAKTSLPVVWSSINAGLLNAPKVVGAAVAIKLMKRWWLKQKEKERLEREKITTELQLLKAQIRPGFLFNALNNIYAYSLAGSPRAPEMLLRLSDLLSYMLYECDKPLVPLEKEIEMMKEYIALEKIRRADSLEMEVTVKGELAGTTIAPFLLLPFIENSFKQSSLMTERPWINMQIKMENDKFSMKLINGITHEISGSPEFHGNGIANVQKRLTLLYPEKYELKASTEQEMFIVFLSIQLNGQEEKITDITETKNEGLTEPVLK
jgi:hypothetical protein